MDSHCRKLASTCAQLGKMILVTDKTPSLLGLQRRSGFINSLYLVGLNKHLNIVCIAGRKTGLCKSKA